MAMMRMTKGMLKSISTRCTMFTVVPYLVSLPRNTVIGARFRKNQVWIALKVTVS